MPKPLLDYNSGKSFSFPEYVRLYTRAKLKFHKIGGNLAQASLFVYA